MAGAQHSTNSPRLSNELGEWAKAKHIKNLRSARIQFENKNRGFAS